MGSDVKWTRSVAPMSLAGKDGQSTVIQVTAGSLSRSAVKLGLGTSVGLSVQDAEAIRSEIPDVVAVSPEVKVKSQVVSGNRNWSPDVYGDSSDYFTIRRWTPSNGQLFTEQD